MAVYNVESAMKKYNIKNNDIEALERKLLRKERFVGVITYYGFDFKTVENMYVYTDRKSFMREIDVCLEIDYPFKYNLIQDRDNERQIERSLY